MDPIEQAKQTWVSAAQFAEIIGASRQAVSKAIFAQRLCYSVKHPNSPTQKRYLINVYDGLLEWQNNTDPARFDTKQIDLYKILQGLKL